MEGSSSIFTIRDDSPRTVAMNIDPEILTTTDGAQAMLLIARIAKRAEHRADDTDAHTRGTS
jgi:hypothetical protein